MTTIRLVFKIQRRAEISQTPLYFYHSCRAQEAYFQKCQNLNEPQSKLCVLEQQREIFTLFNITVVAP